MEQETAQTAAEQTQQEAAAEPSVQEQIAALTKTVAALSEQLKPKQAEAKPADDMTAIKRQVERLQQQLGARQKVSDSVNELEKKFMPEADIKKNMFLNLAKRVGISDKVLEQRGYAVNG